MTIDEYIEQGSDVLKDGGIVIFPTDTAFGIGCLIDHPETIEKLFTLRKRPTTKAVPLLFADQGMVAEYVSDIPTAVSEQLMERHWPGALTIILPAKISKIPSLVRGGGVSIGVRIPDHETPRLLSRKAGVPLIGTSANFHGDPTPYSLAEVNPRLMNLVDYVIPGRTNQGKESTVIDTTVTPWIIRRQGAVEI